MPWTPEDAERHTHKATTPYLRRLWSKTANAAREKYGDARAIRIANAAVNRARNFAIKRAHDFQKP